MAAIQDAPVPTAAPPQHKYDVIDGLRGVAVLAVMIVHTVLLTPLQPEWLDNIFRSGQFGVQLFFVVSAFTMMNSWNGRRQETKKVAKFFIRRYFRIAPMFYVGIALYSVYYFITSKWVFTAGEILSTATFTHGFFPAYINRVVAGGWSIAVEFTFYAIFPILAMIMINRNRSIGFVLVGLAVSLGSYFAVRAASGEPKEFTFHEYWFPNHMVVFALGFVLYFLLRDRIEHVVPTPVARVGFYATIVALLIAGATRQHKVIDHLPFSFLFLSLAYFAVMARPGWITSRWCTHIGINSFSIYIWQYAVINGYGLMNRKLNIGLEGPVGFVVIFGLSVATSAMLAELSRMYIEDPGQALGRKLIKRMG